eukprot:TRINITY_DN4751_c0_g1_i2.p1 TRINITY_DN4751_c0_g1~~TRINITY_DN4751_c0_g1_i2.p1  ORF type:complete len:141 (+),score=9.94 TRINITY_DN4751_c0_g1_i2:156-578(+)
MNWLAASWGFAKFFNDFISYSMWKYGHVALYAFKLTDSLISRGCLAEQRSVQNFRNSQGLTKDVIFNPFIWSLVPLLYSVGVLSWVVYHEFRNFKAEKVVGIEYKDLATDFSQMQCIYTCLLYTSPSPRDGLLSRMPSSA